MNTGNLTPVVNSLDQLDWVFFMPVQSMPGGKNFKLFPPVRCEVWGKSIHRDCCYDLYRDKLHINFPDKNKSKMSLCPHILSETSDKNHSLEYSVTLRSARICKDKEVEQLFKRIHLHENQIDKDKRRLLALALLTEDSSNSTQAAPCEPLFFT